MAFPNTFLDVQNAVKIKGRLSTTGSDDQKVKDWVNRAYYRLCLETEAVPAVSTMNMTANVYSYSFPAAVARLKTMFVTPAGQSETVSAQPPMVRTTLEDIQQRRAFGQLASTGGQYSTHYAYVGINDFEVWPTPAAADVIKLWYAAFPTALVNNTDVPVGDEPYISKLLELGGLLEAGDLLGDPSTDEWKSDYDIELGKYLNHLEQKAGDYAIAGHQWGSTRDTEELYGGGWGGW